MKKFISGVIVGLFLFAGASAFADSASLIGQKVQGLYSVEKDGVKVADAVVINGSTYAPIRALSEATGTDLSVEGKKVIISTKEVTPVNTTSIQEKQKQSRIEGIQKGIIAGKEMITKLENMLKSAQNDLTNATTDGERNAAKESISDAEARLKMEQQALADAEARLAELQQ